jgi:transposase InsO family protein
VQDAYSRQIVGWSMATHMRASLVVDALKMALARRRPGPGLIHYSDQGLRQRSRQDLLRDAQEGACQPPQPMPSSPNEERSASWLVIGMMNAGLASICANEAFAPAAKVDRSRRELRAETGLRLVGRPSRGRVNQR